jgi:hypothetical protein
MHDCIYNTNFLKKKFHDCLFASVTGMHTEIEQKLKIVFKAKKDKINI